MACLINSGITLDCLDGKGGVQAVYITELENLSTFTADTSGNVSAMTLDSGKQFFTFELEKEDAQFGETLTGSVENGTFSYAQSLTFSIKKLSANKRHLLKLIAQNRVMVIILDRNGNYLLMGKTGARLTSTDANTGKLFGDANGYNAITITSNEPEPMYFVASNLIATLTVPA